MVYPSQSILTSSTYLWPVLPTPLKVWWNTFSPTKHLTNPTFFYRKFVDSTLSCRNFGQSYPLSANVWPVLSSLTEGLIPIAPQKSDRFYLLPLKNWPTNVMFDQSCPSSLNHWLIMLPHTESQFQFLLVMQNVWLFLLKRRLINLFHSSGKSV